MEQLLDKMSRVSAFNIVSTRKDGRKDCHLNESGNIDFFLDANDARAALQAAQAAHSDASVALDLEAVPLGKAFSVTQGLMGLRTPVPCKLHFCKATVAAVGEKGIPLGMHDKMRGAGPFPVFSAEQLISPGAMPAFFSHEDLAATWKRSGRPEEALPAPEDAVIDLRVLAASALQEARDCFGKLLFIAPRSSVALQKELATRDERRSSVRENVAAARAIVDAEMLPDVLGKAAHVEDSPPPLTAGVPA